MSSLFKPYALTPTIHLQHRIVLAPLTRNRVTPSGVPILPIVKEYYAQRASKKGTLLITEGVVISERAGGGKCVPVMTSRNAQIWKEVVEAVHEKGSFLFCQLWAMGRTADPEILQQQSSFPYVSASDIPLCTRPTSHPRPRALTHVEIREYVEMFANAAHVAVNEAGFDGVEIQGANGHLIDQFTQSVSNTREDEYGGSVENRARFALEVLDAVTRRVGEERTGIRLSPWETYMDMGMDDPKPTFTYLATAISNRFPRLAYLHVEEPNILPSPNPKYTSPEENNDFIREIWAPPRTLIRCGKYARNTALERSVKEENTLIASGRSFLANPDLSERWERNIALNEVNRETVYRIGDGSGIGYTDYPFAP